MEVDNSTIHLLMCEREWIIIADDYFLKKTCRIFEVFLNVACICEASCNVELVYILHVKNRQKLEARFVCLLSFVLMCWRCKDDQCKLLGEGKTQNVGCPLRAVPRLFLIVMCISQKWCAWINFCSLSLYCIAVVRPTPISFFLSKVIFGEIPMLPAKTSEGTLGIVN